GRWRNRRATPSARICSRGEARPSIRDTITDSTTDSRLDHRLQTASPTPDSTTNSRPKHRLPTRPQTRHPSLPTNLRCLPPRPDRVEKSVDDRRHAFGRLDELDARSVEHQFVLDVG